jgi:transposase-like protein
MDIQSFVKNLSQSEQHDLLKFLQYEIEVPKFELLNNSSNNSSKIECPNCEDSQVVGHGTYKGRGRYMCKSCKKSFNDYTGTAISGIKKVDKFQSYLKLILESVSIRKASKTLELNVKTVLDWRHKIATSLEQINGSKFLGIVECDDKLVNINEKGNKKLDRESYKRPSDRKTKRGVSDDKISIIVATDRKGNPTMKVAKRGRIDSKSVDKSIGDLMDSQNILCSDKHSSIISWAKEKEVEHHTFLAKNHGKNKMFHVQNVNSIDNLYERWIKPFYGISTKFLNQYLNWFMFLQRIKNKTNQVIDLAEIILRNKKAKFVYNEIENCYENLINQQYSKT